MQGNATFLLSAVPDLFVVVGLVVALALVIARRNQIGASASTMAIIGLTILILDGILSIFWNTFGIRLMYGQYRGDNIYALISLYGIATKVLWAVGLGLVIGAIFMRRPAPQPSSAF